MSGSEMMELIGALYPLPRSLTGNGVRESLRLVDAWTALDVVEVPSGTRVYDWTVPPEWNIGAAWIADAAGERIVDLAWSTLHVVGHSEPVHARIRGRDLRSRLHALPDHPHRIPYRTSYYERTWGFCVTGDQLARIADDDEYEVVIDSVLDDGALTYATHVVPGSEPEAGELLVSTYVCHPATCNDNLSGIAVAAALGRWLEPGTLRHDVRILFAPSTIGALCWLRENEARLERIRSGVIVSCVGDRGPLTYKRSRDGSDMDRAAQQVLAGRQGATLHDYVPWGGDERQFSSPGFGLPVGSLSRTGHGLYPEYHTSADDPDFVAAEALADSLDALVAMLEIVDANHRVVRVEPRGEPQLGRHGLQGRMSDGLLRGGEVGRQALLWVLNLADGQRTLLDMAERSGLSFELVREAADVLLDVDLVRVVR